MAFDGEKKWGGKYDVMLEKATQGFHDYLHDIAEPLSCESEIERMLAFVLFLNQTISGYNHGSFFAYKCHGFAHPSHFTFDEARSLVGEPNVNFINVFPQTWIGAYRADFLCLLNLRLNDRPAQLHHLAIECDGHDFHEKTKEQAARDKSRDRSLLLHGVPCMRFAGSEIWKDAYACAKQIDDFFYSTVYRRVYGEAPRCMPSETGGDA